MQNSTAATAFKNELEFARERDQNDSLKDYRKRFHFPMHNKEEVVYFTGNSLGLQPKTTQEYIQQERAAWD